MQSSCSPMTKQLFVTTYPVRFTASEFVVGSREVVLNPLGENSLIFEEADALRNLALLEGGFISAISRELMFRADGDLGKDP